MSELQRILEWSPAFDRRDPNLHKNYGIHGVEMRFVVKGPLGAVQFLLYTNWQLPHVRKEFAARGCDTYCLNAPMPADLGYHSPRPLYEGQEPISDKPCPYLDGKLCYYDGSGLNAERIFDVLCAEGDMGVWRELEAYYRETFSRPVVEVSDA